MYHAGIRERGREMGGRWEEEEGMGGGEVGGRWGGDVFARISHESCSVCMKRVSLCYSIGSTKT